MTNSKTVDEDWVVVANRLS